MDATEVTNKQFVTFVEATGYITAAEQKPTKDEFPTAPPENLVAGSTVFVQTTKAVHLNNYFQWWNYVAGAAYLATRSISPIVHVLSKNAFFGAYSLK
jgi:formylglycine-generating enzyme required for sulfatase activity